MNDKNVFEFVIYIIHACANKWNRYPSDVYRILNDNNCINNFLVSHYDILHTQSTAYIVDDVKEYLNVRGVIV
ncbi:MAG: DUF3791 domain-containing protein [Oscillospiraceae bacterium]|nr:DUF3791 domain-containing protein [Oscillospiraceae bacterium]